MSGLDAQYCFTRNIDLCFRRILYCNGMTSTFNMLMHEYQLLWVVKNIHPAVFEAINYPNKEV